jgi:hypothetical protein
VVNQNVFQLTPTTPQATFIPDQGTIPIDRMTNKRRQTAWEPVPEPMGAAVGSGEIWTGVTCSPVGTDVGGEGTISGARAACTSASGLGNKTAMSGARGRERQYEPREPVAVMTVKRARAAVGSRTEPTRIF